MQIGKKHFDWNAGTSYVMGILNVTPDSFSDGNQYNHLSQAIDHAAQMIKDGAHIIDIGGESTRPGHIQISDEEEISRITPVIEALKQRFDIPLSVDTYKSTVAKAAFDAGADMLNDIWGLTYDNNIASIVAEYKKPVCLMHNRKEIPIAPDGHTYSASDYLDLLEQDLKHSIDIAINAGIPKEHIILDPGIGFAKDLDMNLMAISYIERLHKLSFPVLLGISRKSLIEKTLHLPVDQREEATIALNVIGRMNGCHIFRVHNVLGNVRALQMTDVILKAKEK